MDVEDISHEILEIRERLSEIESERARLLTGEHARKAALQNEAHELRERLADLRAKLTVGDRARDEKQSREQSSPRFPEIPPM